MKTTPLHLFFIGFLVGSLFMFGVAATQAEEPGSGDTTISAEPAPTSAEPAPTSDADTTPPAGVSSEPSAPPPSGSATGNLYTANYQSGNAPFKEKTKVTIQQSGDSYTFVPAVGEAWNIPLKDVRGAVESNSGVWFYWYDSGGSTLNGFFKMDLSKTTLAGEVNNAVAAYHNRPRDQEEEYRQKYQSYEEQAIKEAK